MPTATEERTAELTPQQHMAELVNRVVNQFGLADNLGAQGVEISIMPNDKNLRIRASYNGQEIGRSTRSMRGTSFRKLESMSEEEQLAMVTKIIASAVPEAKEEIPPNFTAEEVAFVERRNAFVDAVNSTDNPTNLHEYSRYVNERDGLVRSRADRQRRRLHGREANAEQFDYITQRMLGNNRAAVEAQQGENRAESILQTAGATGNYLQEETEQIIERLGLDAEPGIMPQGKIVNGNYQFQVDFDQDDGMLHGQEPLKGKAIPLGEIAGLSPNEVVAKLTTNMRETFEQAATEKQNEFTPIAAYAVGATEKLRERETLQQAENGRNLSGHNVRVEGKREPKGAFARGRERLKQIGTFLYNKAFGKDKDTNIEFEYPTAQSTQIKISSEELQAFAKSDEIPNDLFEHMSLEQATAFIADNMAVTLSDGARVQLLDRNASPEKINSVRKQFTEHFKEEAKNLQAFSAKLDPNGEHRALSSSQFWVSAIGKRSDNLKQTRQFDEFAEQLGLTSADRPGDYHIKDGKISYTFTGSNGYRIEGSIDQNAMKGEQAEVEKAMAQSISNSIGNYDYQQFQPGDKPTGIQEDKNGFDRINAQLKEDYLKKHNPSETEKQFLKFATEKGFTSNRKPGQTEYRKGTVEYSFTGPHNGKIEGSYKVAELENAEDREKFMRENLTQAVQSYDGGALLIEQPDNAQGIALDRAYFIETASKMNHPEQEQKTAEQETVQENPQQTAEIERLKKELAASQKRNTDLTKQVQDNNTTIASLGEENGRIAEELAGTKQQMAAMQASISQMVQEAVAKALKENGLEVKEQAEEEKPEKKGQKFTDSPNVKPKGKGQQQKRQQDLATDMA